MAENATPQARVKMMRDEGGQLIGAQSTLDGQVVSETLISPQSAQATAPSTDDISLNFITEREAAVGKAAWAELDRDAATPSEPTAISRGESVVEGAKTVTKGVVRTALENVAEIPRAVATGVGSAVRDVYNATDSAARWVRANPNIFQDFRDSKPAGKERVLPAIPEMMADPKTTMGSLVKGFTKFAALFATAGKLPGFARLAAAGETSVAARVAGPTIQGAVADFVSDPYEKGLSDFLSENKNTPKFVKAVADYVAAKPDDPEPLRRLKKTAEGAMSGLALDGLIQMVSVVRARRVARNAAAGDDAALDNADAAMRQEIDEQMLEGVAEDTVRSFGDPAKGPFIQRVQPKLEAAAEASEGVTPKQAAPADVGQDIDINWASIDSENGVKKTLQAMVDADKPGIADATRGVRTWTQTKMSAGQKNAWKILEQRRVGGALNAEQLTALRQLWIASGEKLREVALRARDLPSTANLVVFRRMVAVHWAIQREVRGATAEAGRSLNILRAPIGTTGKRLKQMEALIELEGGADITEQLASDIYTLMSTGKSAKAEKLIELGATSRTWDALLQARYAAMLSSPVTHAANFISNLATAATMVTERAVAARIGAFDGTVDPVEIGEATQMLFGMVEGFKDSLRALRQEGSLLSGPAAEALARGTKVEGRPSAFSPDVWGHQSDSLPGQALGLIDAVTSSPRRALEGGDNLWKMTLYRGEMRAQAFRIAKEEMQGGRWYGPLGVNETAQTQFKKRYADLLENPDREMIDAAIATAQRGTFTNKPSEMLNRFAVGFQQLELAGVPLGRLFMPFKNTPINILTFGAERTPFAPLVKNWQQDLARGGAHADLAVARVATGSAVMLSALDLALSGRMTGRGPRNKGEREALERQGWQPYSVKVGNRWVSFARTEPLGAQLGYAADLAEIIMNADTSENRSIRELTYGGILMFAKNTTSKTYMRGVQDLFDAIANGESKGAALFENTVSSFVPAVAGAVARQVDPWQRTATDALDRVVRRIPHYSAGLPAYRDLWGSKVSFRAPGLPGWDLLMPFAMRTESKEPIDEELTRLDSHPLLPKKELPLPGLARGSRVKVDIEDFPHVYERYVQLAGNVLKDPRNGLGAKDYLNALVKGDLPESAQYFSPSRTDGPDGGRAATINNTIRRYRELAAQQIIEEFPEISAIYDRKKYDSVGGQ